MPSPGNPSERPSASAKHQSKDRPPLPATGQKGSRWAQQRCLGHTKSWFSERQSANNPAQTPPRYRFSASSDVHHAHRFLNSYTQIPPFSTHPPDGQVRGPHQSKASMHGIQATGQNWQRQPGRPAFQGRPQALLAKSSTKHVQLRFGEHSVEHHPDCRNLDGLASASDSRPH